MALADQKMAKNASSRPKIPARQHSITIRPIIKKALVFCLKYWSEEAVNIVNVLTYYFSIYTALIDVVVLYTLA